MTVSRSPFDTSTLADPIDEIDLRRFRAAAVGLPSYEELNGATGHPRLMFAVLVGFGLTLELVLAGIPVAILFAVGAQVAALVVLFVVPFLLAWVYWRSIEPIVRVQRSIATEWPRRYRLARFAQSNGLSYVPEVQNPKLPAVVFDAGIFERRLKDVFAGQGFEVGAFHTSNGMSKTFAPKGWGYVRVRLDREIPHLLMTPKRTRRYPARMFVPVRNDQVLGLEGDFGRHFTLYCPVGYERDALYVVTPDLMSLLIDRVPGSFVEMRGHDFTITFPGPLDPTTEQAWTRYAELLGTIGRKGQRQTARYSDDRSRTAGSVARQGRLLKAGIPIGAVIAGVYITLQIVRLLHGF